MVTLSKSGANTLFASALVCNIYVVAANAEGLAVDPINHEFIDLLELSSTASDTAILHLPATPQSS